MGIEDSLYGSVVASQSVSSSTISSYEYAELIKRVMSSGAPGKALSMSLDLKDDENIKKLVAEMDEAFRKLGMLKILEDVEIGRTDPTTHYYMGYGSCLRVYLSGLTGDASLTTQNDSVVAEYLRVFKPYSLAELPNQGRVSTMSLGRSGKLIVREIGFAGVSFEPKNYVPGLEVKYNKIVSEFTKKTPSGRLVILEGPPGTGKTYLTRNFIHDLPHCRFILIPSHLIATLGDPGMVDTLIDERSNARKAPLVLLVEDADMAVNARMADNMAAISSLLNFCDGILGSVLDIRVIATTNSKMTDIDNAVLRPGRLCEYIHIDKLPVEQANEVYNRLTGQEGPYTKAMPLCEIYANANVPQVAGQFADEDSYPPVPQFGF